MPLRGTGRVKRSPNQVIGIGDERAQCWPRHGDSDPRAQIVGAILARFCLVGKHRRPMARHRFSSMLGQHPAGTTIVEYDAETVVLDAGDMPSRSGHPADRGVEAKEMDAVTVHKFGTSNKWS